MLKEKNLLIQAAAGSSRSMQLLVCWPLAGAWGAGEVLPRCAQLLWCELYVMKDLQQKNVPARQRSARLRRSRSASETARARSPASARDVGSILSY